MPNASSKIERSIASTSKTIERAPWWIAHISVAAASSSGAQKSSIAQEARVKTTQQHTNKPTMGKSELGARIERIAFWDFLS